MATITREQAMKRQAQAPENWRYDWKHYVIWNENQLIRNIEQADGSVIRATVSFREGIVKHATDWGSTWNTPSGTYHVEVRVNRWTCSNPETDVWTSYGIGKARRISVAEFTRRNYKDLCKLAAEVDDKVIMDVWES